MVRGLDAKGAVRRGGRSLPSGVLDRHPPSQRHGVPSHGACLQQHVSKYPLPRQANAQFVDTIGKLGVQKIEAKGERFDPSLHEAIQQIETSDQPAGTVVADLLSGYKMGDRLVKA